MSAREFYGESLKACLEQVKRTLGSDAIIIETKKAQQGGGLLGMPGREIICVVAATEEEYGVFAEPEETDKDILAIRDTLARLRASASQAKQNPVSPARPALNNGFSQSSASAIVAARNAYANPAPPTTRLDNPRSAASKPLYRKASFPTVERPAQSEEESLSSALAPTPAPRTAALSANVDAPHSSLPAPSAVIAPPAIRNLTPLTLPTRAPQDASLSQLGAQAHAAVIESEAVNEAPTAETAEPTGRMGKNLLDLRQNLQQLRARFTDYEKNLTAVVSKGSALSETTVAARTTGAYPALRTRLRTQGVSSRLIEDLIRDIPDLSEWGEAARPIQAEAIARELITGRIAVSGAIQLTPGALKTVALVGPTGVGKTTTIAKLAAQFALLERKKTALLTIDVYRIAAIEQLKTYGQIMGVPVFAAHEASEIADVLERCRDYDLLLVDTAGRSQLNGAQVMELKPFLDALQCETHLVLSASTKEEDLLESARRFSATRVDRLLFTKLDETSSYGSLLNVADKTGAPLSYLTMGQRVPEDIEVAHGMAIAGRILP